MTWDVNWAEDAENELATVWLDPALRAAVTRASRRIDERLERDGDSEGESRGGDRRIMFEPPLGATFTVDRVARRVTVTHVWAFET
jgi:hypothetical protein